MTAVKRSPKLSTRPAAARAAADIAPVRGCTSFKLRQLSRRVSAHYDRAVAGAGLKTTQYSLLSHLVKLAPIRPGELAAVMAMDASTLTRNLQVLVAQGWATVDAGTDARSRFVNPSAAGRAKRTEAQRAWKRAQLMLNEQLGPANVAALHALIDDCLLLMNDTPAGDSHD